MRCCMTILMEPGTTSPQMEPGTALVQCRECVPEHR